MTPRRPDRAVAPECRPIQRTTAALVWAAERSSRAGRGGRIDVVRAAERADLPRVETLRAARSASGRAIEIAPTLGDRERALGLLEPHVGESRQRAWRQLPWDPVWEPVRGEPRFVAVLERMGLSRE